MPTVVVGRLEPTGFPLERTLDSLEGVEFECERVVVHGDSVTALVWAYAPEGASVEETLEADPSVGQQVLMADLGAATLYRIDLVRDLSFLRYVTREAKGTLLDGYGTHRNWQLCITYPDREGLTATESFCDSRGLAFEVTQERSVPDEPIDRHGLTTEQYEALHTAWRLGYFDVPRKVDLKEVAAELGISHQAASERLRRGHETVVRELLGTTAQERLYGV